MKTGDIVRIENAYFKNDNGLYFVACSPEDPTWSGSDYSLRKLCKNGKISTAKYNICFWPLATFTNSYETRITATAWNKEHATIEVVEGITKEYILQYFQDEARQARETANHYINTWGDTCKDTEKMINIADFYDNLVAELSPKKETASEWDSLEGPATPEECKQLDMIVEHQQAKRVYYPINESIARTANDLNSFSEYKEGSETAVYKAYVDIAFDIADKIRDKKPNLADKAYYIADRYAKKYADYINAYNRNEAGCPSILVSGGSNFPVHKKNKQNARRDSLYQEYLHINGYVDKLKGLLYNNQPIKSGDEDAIERLQDKIQDLEAEKEIMKAVNAYYRSNNHSLEGYEGETPEWVIKQYALFVHQGWTSWRTNLFDTANTNAEIKRCKDRLEKLQTVKEQGTTETETDLFTIVENTEIMRLQLFFDGIPSEEIRNVLKHNGFRWSPKNQAWQRQLTDNAKYSLKLIMKELSA